MYGSTANDETRERYAECPGCGSHMTHLQARDLWHCHGCGYYWHSDTGMPGDDIPRDPCATEDADLWW